MLDIPIPSECLVYQGWLLDNSMNAIGWNIHSTFPNVVVNSTHLCPNIKDGTAAVGWLPKLLSKGSKDINNVDLMLFPTNNDGNLHWELFAVDLATKWGTAYNSMV